MQETQYQSIELFTNRLQTRDQAMRITAKAVLAYRIKNDGTAPVLLQVILNRKRITFPLGFCLHPKHLNNGRVIQNHPDTTALNLVIDKAKSKITDIQARYYLSEKVLDAETLTREFRSTINRQDFIEFCKQVQHMHKLSVEQQSIAQHGFVIDKLETFAKKKLKRALLFSDLSEELINKYQHWERTELGNQQNTINKSLTVIKFYVRRAQREGIRFNNPFQFLKISKVVPHKTSLTQDEVKALFDYYENPDCPKGHHHLLRYFLFSCRTGLRISDISRVEWGHIHGQRLIMPMYKNNRRKNKMIDIPIGTELHLIPEYNPRRKYVFDCYANAFTNRMLKDIAKAVGIKKRLTYHIARHTFGTSFLERGGSVEVLQQLMGHSEIETTMVYVHMTDKRMREQKDLAFASRH